LTMSLFSQELAIKSTTYFPAVSTNIDEGYICE
jgi:hypothetical protein